MTKLFLALSLFFFTATTALAQKAEIPLNSKTVFKDINGNRISFETFIQWTSGDSHKIAPVFDEEENLIEVFVLDASVAPSVSPNAKPLSSAPPFRGTAINNQSFDMGTLLGKVVVMKFWFAACKPCVDEMPQLNTVVEKYRGNPDVVFIAPSLDKKAQIESFLTRHPFAYNIIPESRDIADQFNVFGYPTHFVINRVGKIEAMFSGVNRTIDDKLSAAIEKGLNPPTQLEIRTTVPPPPMPTEVVINPNSLIKDENGKIVPFDQFVVLMREGMFELENATDEEGSYVLMKEVTQRN